MEITLQRPALAALLGRAIKAMPGKSLIPMYDYFYFDYKGQTLALTGASAESGVTLLAAVAERGRVGAAAIPARPLHDLVVGYPGDEPLTLTTDDRHRAMITCGRFYNRLNAVDPKEYPAVPTTTMPAVSKGRAGLLASIDQFVTLLSAVSTSAAGDAAGRPIYTAVYLAHSGKQLTLAATDGFRVSEAKLAVKASGNEPLGAVVMPLAAVQQLAALLVDEPSDTVRIWADLQRIHFATGGFYFWAQLVQQGAQATYPNYAPLLRSKHSTTAQVDLKMLIAALQVAAVVAREGNNNVSLDIDPKTGSISLYSASAALGHGEVTIDAAIKGAPVQVGINGLYLLDALHTVTTPAVLLQFDGAASGVMAQDDESAEALPLRHLLMPMVYQRRE